MVSPEIFEQMVLVEFVTYGITDRVGSFTALLLAIGTTISSAFG
jgi:hypothetical protein